MNYQSLKWMIESLIKSYKCPECLSWINDVNIDIIWAAWTTLNIDIECAKCLKHSIVKTEVLSINLSNRGLSEDNIMKLKKSLLSNNWWKISKKLIIKDEEIVDLNKNLKKNKLNVSDLLWDI